MPIPSLKSICAVRLLQSYNFDSTEREYIRNKLEPVPSLVTQEHTRLVKERLGTSNLDYGLLVESHEVLINATGNQTIFPMIQMYRARTTYILAPRGWYDNVSQVSMLSQEKVEVEFQWSRTYQQGFVQNLSFYISVQYKGSKEILEQQRWRAHQGINLSNEEWSPDELISLFEVLIKDLRAILGVRRLFDLLPQAEVKRLRATFSDISKDNDQVIESDSNIEMLLLTEAFLGESKDDCLILRWLSRKTGESETNCWAWMQELLFLIDEEEEEV